MQKLDGGRNRNPCRVGEGGSYTSRQLDSLNIQVGSQNDVVVVGRIRIAEKARSKDARYGCSGKLGWLTSSSTRVGFGSSSPCNGECKLGGSDKRNEAIAIWINGSSKARDVNQRVIGIAVARGGIHRHRGIIADG